MALLIRTDLTGNISSTVKDFFPFQLTGQSQGITVRLISVLLASKHDVNTTMNAVHLVQASISISYLILFPLNNSFDFLTVVNFVSSSILTD